MDHMLTLAVGNILSRDNYGDWCVPPEEATLIHSKDPARQTDKSLLATSYFYYDLCLMEHFATMLGKADDAARWRKLAADFKTSFNARFLDRRPGPVFQWHANLLRPAAGVRPGARGPEGAHFRAPGRQDRK